jgi:Uma2 family endonuclease
MGTILEEAAAGRVTIVPWTVDQYHRAIEAGLVPHDVPLELIDGFIVRKNRAAAGDDPMAVGERHRVTLMRLAEAASAFEAHGCFLQTQQPISLPPNSEPEPDGAVVNGAIDDYLNHPPTAKDVSCVVEVADGSLSVDLGPKLLAYAKAGIPQYLVVDLVNDHVVIHEEPEDGTYSLVTTLYRGDTVPIAGGAKHVAMGVDRLLP